MYDLYITGANAGKVEESGFVTSTTISDFEVAVRELTAIAKEEAKKYEKTVVAIKDVNGKVVKEFLLEASSDLSPF